jgi:hypothetical protein
MLRHGAEPTAQQVALFPVRRTDDMSLRNESAAKQLRQRGRIHRIRLHLRVTDRLDVFAVPQPHVNALGHEQIPQPIPGRSRLDDGLMRTGELGEVRLDQARRGRQLRVRDGAAIRIHGGDDHRALV